MIADLICSNEEPDRAAIGVADGLQLRVRAALGPADQVVASGSFSARRLVAARCDLSWIGPIITVFGPSASETRSKRSGVELHRPNTRAMKLFAGR